VISSVARNQAVRQLLVEQQRRVGRRLGSFVTEGRDQGTVVFPDAEFRFVLLADLPMRAERRYREMVADGEDVDIKAVTDNLVRRDRVDSKQWEPLLASGNVPAIDTTNLSIHQVLDRILTELGVPGA
jgi:cytidylate kinase